MRMEFDEEKLATFRRKENKKADVPVFAFNRLSESPKPKNPRTSDEGANRKIITGKNV